MQVQDVANDKFSSKTRGAARSDQARSKSGR
jgi:hypothetical protein